MTQEVKNFIETNYQLLDTNTFEFYMSAYSGLSRTEQGLLVDTLEEAGINTSAREPVLRYIITMTLQDITTPIRLATVVSRLLNGVLGFNNNYIYHYIIDNAQEWDNRISRVGDGMWVYPVRADYE